MGEDIHLIINYGHIKPPYTNAHTVVHSDLLHLRGVPHHESLLMLKCMYVLTEIREGSGGLKVYPGTHRMKFENYPPLPRTKEVYVKAKPGDLIIFNANLLHTATPSSTDSPRLSLWYVYAHSWMRVFAGYEPSAPFLSMISNSSFPIAEQIFGLNPPYTTYAQVPIK